MDTSRAHRRWALKALVYLFPLEVLQLFTKCRAGGTQRLPRIVGRSVAKELIFTGRRFDAIEALSMGKTDYLDHL